MRDKNIHNVDKIFEHFIDFILQIVQLLLITFTVDSLDIDKFEQVHSQNKIRTF